MAEPTIRADQHAHVEAENRLHNELVILYRDEYMWQRLKQSLKLHDWPRVEIYQPYISLLNVLAAVVICAWQRARHTGAGTLARCARFWPVVRGA